MKPFISVDIMYRITKKVYMYIMYSSEQQSQRHLSNKKMNIVRAVRWYCLPEGSQCLFIVLVHLVQYTRSFIIRWWDEMCVLNHNKPVWCLYSPGGCTTLYTDSTLYYVLYLKHRFSSTSFGTRLWIVWKSVAVRVLRFIWVRAKSAC